MNIFTTHLCVRVEVAHDLFLLRKTAAFADISGCPKGFVEVENMFVAIC